MAPQVIEANILLSGLGAESGGLAAAHGFHNALTLLPETHNYMHGEKVAFGTLVQLVLDGDLQEAEKVGLDLVALDAPGGEHWLATRTSGQVPSATSVPHSAVQEAEKVGCGACLLLNDRLEWACKPLRGCKGLVFLVL